MRIEKLRLKNLNSLKGLHEIDFTEGVLKNEGIFAITGPTGAGKTTLLDAICLALYNQIPRVGKISKNSISDFGSLCTKHTQDSFAEVEYSINDSKYRSHWSIRTNRNGNLNDYHMELANALTGEIFDFKKGEVPAQNSLVIGLDFDQFLKSSLLAQGEFSQFLKAKKNERGELLEKITGTTLYRELSILAYEKEGEERKVLEQLEQKATHIKILTDAELNALNQELDTDNTFVQKQTKELEKLSSQLTLFEDVEALIKELELVSHEQELVKNQDLQFESKRKLVHQHHQIQPHVVEIDTFVRLEKEFDDLLLKTEKTKNSISETEHNTQELFGSKKNLNNELEQFLLAKDELLPVIDQVRKIDKSLNLKEQEVSLQKDKFNKISVQLSKLKHDLALQNEGFEKKEKDFKEFEEKLTQSDEISRLKENMYSIESTYEMAANLSKEFNSLKDKLVLNDESYLLLLKNKTLKVSDAKKSIDQLIEDLKNICGNKLISKNDLKESLNQLLETKEHKVLYASLLQKQKSIQKDITEKESLLKQQALVDQKIVDLNQSIKDFIPQIEFLKLDVQELEIQNERAKLEAKYDKDRELLKKGESCFLCGSLEHPYVHKYESKIDLLQEKLSFKKRELEALEKNLSKTETSLNGEQIRLSSLNEQISELINQLNNGVTEFDSLIENHGFEKIELNEEGLVSIDNMIRDLDRKRTLQESKLAQQEDLERLIPLSELAQRALEEGEKYRDLIKPFLSLVSGYKPIDFKNAILSFEQLAEKVRLLSEELKLDKVSITHLQNQVVEQAIVENIEREFLQKLNTENDSIRSERVHLFGDKLVEDVLKQFDSDEKQITLKQNQIELDLQKLNLFLEKQQENLIDIDLRKSKTEKELFALRKLLSDVCTKFEVASVLDLMTFILSTDKLSELIKEEKTIIERLNRLDEKCSLLKSSITSKSLLIEDLNLDELKLRHTSLKGELEIVSKKIGEILYKLKQDQDNKLTSQALINEILAQKKIYEPWYNLFKLIGSADGKKFSVFAQELTLQHLIFLANNHLKSLSDRYLLMKEIADDKKDDLFVIDRWQGDSSRAVSTLSGGESFIVSLALALGLAEMASKNVKIGSLFIDEGFGSLDQSALDIVLDVLEKLQYTSDCKIGVISHVEMLKERIPTQIQLERNNSGYSSIRLVG